MSFVKTNRSRRIALFIAATDVAILGLVLHYLVPGDVASLITDALFTVLLYLLLALIAPTAQRHRLALGAFAISAVIEFAQLTGVPAQLAVSFPPSRLVLGTTFSALDLVAYAAGAIAVYYADVALSQRIRPWFASRSE
ncbi:DUF2809 domain-containing protein [Arthrobacter sp. GMC3]|uniref:ribosomal maturation YjgA family protein n=1 Tax=Arthrobacter sp. GMC3 TaxID=2058894 RepID=UPI000CE45578|nr:DUF2809 domain-containing protein [Arthrobacter sp. GMC3]